MTTKIYAALVAVGLAAFSAASQADAWDDYDRPAVTLWNESGYTIREFNMSLHSDTHWHGDLLGDSVLRSGYHTTIHAAPGYYDVKLVDSDGDECVVDGISIDGDRRLTVTPDMLLRCEGYRQ